MRKTTTVTAMITMTTMRMRMRTRTTTTIAVDGVVWVVGQGAGRVAFVPPIC